MKNIYLLLIISFLSFPLIGQVEQDRNSTVKDYYLIKTDSDNYVGIILEENPREMLIVTKDNRELYIPQYAIRNIRPVNPEDFRGDGMYIGPDKFASKYFINTNAIPLEKGGGYVQWNLYGPDFQFGLGNNISVGVTSTWIGAPIIANVKKSWEVGKNGHASLGAMIATGSWSAIQVGGFLPTATYTYGNHRHNVSVMAGYGAYWVIDEVAGSRAVIGLSGMTKISPKISLVFDSFNLVPGRYETITRIREEYQFNSITGKYELVKITDVSRSRNPGFSIISPGIRWHKGENNSFQFGFTGLAGDYGVISIPMIQWFRTL